MRGSSLAAEYVHEARMLFQEPELTALERDLVRRLESLRDTLRYFVRRRRRWRGGLRRDVEGGETRPDLAAGSSYFAAMSYVLMLADDPDFSYSLEVLRALHHMLLQHDVGRWPGRLRRGAVYVRNEHHVVREPPAAAEVPELLRELLATLQNESSTPVWVRAAMAHLNIVGIHPFVDANGRMARCLESLVLARSGIVEEPFVNIEECLGRLSADYYRVLAEVAGHGWDPSRDARPWVRFCLEAHVRHAENYAMSLRDGERAANALQYEKLFRDWHPDPTLDSAGRERAWQAQCNAELQRVRQST